MTNLTITRGDSATIHVDVSSGGTPVDLTGYTLWFTAKAAYTDADADAAIQKGNAGGLSGVSLMTGPGGANTRIKIVLSPADTESLAAKPVTLHYDVQAESAGGDIYTITRGDLLVQPDVTVTKV